MLRGMRAVYFFGFGARIRIILFPSRRGHLLHFGPLFQIGREAQQQDFALILENDLNGRGRRRMP